MACNKYLVAVLFASVVILELSNASDLKVGSRQWGDYLIQSEHLTVPSKWLRQVKTTKTFSGDGRSNITRIELIDNNKKG